MSKLNINKNKLFANTIKIMFVINGYDTTTVIARYYRKYVNII